MIIQSKGISIELEQDEIDAFCNIIMFALDLQAERDKENKLCMNAKELKLAKKLVEITEKINMSKILI